MENTDIAILLPFVRVGGVERIMSNLARWFKEQGLRVDLVVATNIASDARYLCAAAARTIVLGARHPYGGLPQFVAYLKETRPSAVLAALTPSNALAVLGTKFMRPKPLVVCSVHVAIDIGASTSLCRSFLRPLAYRLLYSQADSVIGVSEGISQALHKFGVSSNIVSTIYNPVVDANVLYSAEGDLDHPWFKDPVVPVVLGVGRLEPQKDFATLMQAFSIARQAMPIRLVILGDGSRREELELLATRLGISSDVSMPGFVINPYIYMKYASVFVMTSAWEGFGNVIAEALAMGVPVVSTDCPVGPSEILSNGRYGSLVPVGDASAVAQAILDTLACPPNRAELMTRGMDFSVDAIGPQYLRVLGLSAREK